MEEANSGKNGAVVPSLTLPKGGGAIRGIGEKFAANSETGTFSVSISRLKAWPTGALPKWTISNTPPEKAVAYIKGFLMNVAELSDPPLMRMFSMKHEFSTEWHKFLHPSVA